MPIEEALSVAKQIAEALAEAHKKESLSERCQMIYISDALHISGTDPLHPQWDTLISLLNTRSDSVLARIRLRTDDGSIVQWPGLGDHYDVEIEPGLMWAMSFLPGNPLPTPPQDWQGSATVECFKMPLNPFSNPDVSADIGCFTLLAFSAWHNGINAPCRKDVTPKPFAANNHWVFPYAIPYFDDTQGATQRQWLTGVLINNQDSQPATGFLRYTVGQNYIQKGQKFQIPFSLGPYEKKRFDLYLGNPAQGVQGVKDVGYAEGLNSEGHIDVFTNQTVLLQPSMLIADKSYSFTVTEDYEG